MSAAHSFTYSPTSLASGTYLWSVQSTRVVPSGYQADGASTTATAAYASPFNFRYCSTNSAPSAPTLVSPLSVSIDTANYTQASSTASAYVAVTLSWNIPSFGVTCYSSSNFFLLSWSLSSAFSPAYLLQVSGTQSSYTQSFTSGLWYWNVTASNGGESRFVPFNQQQHPTPACPL